MSRILILGATGFIGRNMVEHFSSLGHEVLAVHFKSDPYLFHGGNWCGTKGMDLRTPDLNLIQTVKPDIIIQAAATTSGSKDIVNVPAIHVTDNAIMNSLVMRAAHEVGVKHVIFFSCTTMFSNGVVTEESPIDIHPKYFGVAHTKLYVEKLCEFYASLGKTKFTVIRHSNVYGPYDKFDLEKSHVFGATVTKVMNATDKVTVWGSGQEGRDLLYIDDLCDFVDMAIEKQPTKFALYNCGSGKTVSINSLVHEIISASGKDITIEYNLHAATIPVSILLDCTKAQAELGWKPKTFLEEGIQKTLEWYRENFHVA